MGRCDLVWVRIRLSGFCHAAYIKRRENVSCKYLNDKISNEFQRFEAKERSSSMLMVICCLKVPSHWMRWVAAIAVCDKNDATYRTIPHRNAPHPVWPNLYQKWTFMVAHGTASRIPHSTASTLPNVHLQSPSPLFTQSMPKMLLMETQITTSRGFLLR